MEPTGVARLGEIFTVPEWDDGVRHSETMLVVGLALHCYRCDCTLGQAHRGPIGEAWKGSVGYGPPSSKTLLFVPGERTEAHCPRCRRLQSTKVDWATVDSAHARPRPTHGPWPRM